MLTHAPTGEGRPWCGESFLTGALTSVFFKAAVSVGYEFMGLGFLGAILAYLKPPRSLPVIGEASIRIGPLQDLKKGEARFVPHERQPLWVVYTERGHLIALSAVCTHLRCILRWDWERKELMCPCHGGAFDLNGNVVAGPPPRPLRTFEINVRGGTVYVRLA